ncbi:hypothetical protein [Burkholderia stagnalis]
MFEETVLRFSDKERQSELAEREQELAARLAALQTREKNFAHRQEWMVKEPQAVLNALNTDIQHREEDKRLAEQANALKARFGLSTRDMIDTPTMRAALEQALTEKDVEQQQRSERIADRAALIAGLDKLSMIDVKKVQEILHANKEIKSTREWSRDELAGMFAKAQSWKDENGQNRYYPKTMDGWAKSLADRERALELAEIKLDAKEVTLRGTVERRIATLETTAEVLKALGTEATGQEIPQPAGIQRSEISVPVQSMDQGKAVPPTRKEVDLSLSRLANPEKFEAAATEYAASSGIAIEKARETLGALRDIKATQADQHAAKATSLLDLAEDRQRANGDSARSRETSAAVGREADGAQAVKSETARSPDRAIHASSTTGQARTQDATFYDVGAAADSTAVVAKSNVIEMEPARRAPAAGREVAAGQETTAAQVALQEAAREGAAASSLGRNKAGVVLEQSAESNAQPGKQEIAQGELALSTPEGPGKEPGQQRHFAELSADEQQARREQFMGDLRQSAGYSRDGKEAVTERAKEAESRGKERAGRALGE